MMPIGARKTSAAIAIVIQQHRVFKKGGKEGKSPGTRFIK